MFDSKNGMVQYTNVLVDFISDQCIPELVMRPYAILEHENGTQVTIYGGVVQRSIGHIATQNRTAFAEGTRAYTFIWNIIEHCYGDLYSRSTNA